MERHTTADPQALPEPAVESTSAGPWHLQLREERLRVDKQQEPAGSVRVGTRVVERVETIDVPVREERLVIDHRAGSGRVIVGGRELAQGESIDVPVMRERAIVTKEPVVIEEITVRKEVFQRTEHQRETVHREELTVDDPAGVAISSPAGRAARPG